jgi:hypothetical protein
MGQAACGTVTQVKCEISELQKRVGLATWLADLRNTASVALRQSIELEETIEVSKSKTVITTPRLTTPKAPYSVATMAENLMFISGLVSVDEHGELWGNAIPVRRLIEGWR